MPESREKSLGCLAQAISYEAGHEPLAGQEAVAAVVLNRFRHHSFPKTVCGVVYQGSNRRTGCQFTFTCDGSLVRRRSAVAVEAARAVAARALDGLSDGGVGDALFYHADYVSPYWAPALERVAQIGAHIFYRFPGRGTSTAAAAGPPASQAVFSVWGLAAITVSATGVVVEASDR